MISKDIRVNNFRDLLFMADFHDDVLDRHEEGARKDRGPDPLLKATRTYPTRIELRFSK